MVTLKPITENAFANFVDEAVSSYAQANIESGRWSKVEALELSRTELSKILSNGLATEGHFVFEIVADEEANSVGYLWLGESRRGSSKVAFIYQIEIKPEYRRKGYARQALHAAEAFCTSKGWSGIGLPMVSKIPFMSGGR